MYGTMYGMRKTTVYLPDELKRALERRAAELGRSEAELIRDALAHELDRARPPPRIPLTGEPLGDPTAAERVDELLADFGT